MFKDNGSPLKFAVMNCHYIKYPLEYFFHQMSRLGLTNIELFGAMPHFYMEDVDQELIGRVKRQCEERGLKLVSFCPAQGTYPVNIAIREARVRERSLDMMRRAVRAAGALGCETMLVSAGFGYQNESRDIAWGYSRESLGELAREAGEQKVVLTIEPLTPGTANLVNTSRDAARMIEEVGSPWLKAMMDIGVMNYMGETVDDYFANLGDNLRHIHFTDGPGAHVALGDGTFPMYEYAKDIIRHGYKGFLSFEINDKRYVLNPDQAVEKNISWLREHGFSG